MNITRRGLGQIALAALPAARLLAKTNSKFGGVQIGINAPYSFHGAYNTGDECLEAMVKLNLSSVELRAQPIEQFMGAPANLVAYPAGGRRGAARPPGAGGQPGTPPAEITAPAGQGARGARAPLTPEQQEARKAGAEELRK